MATDRFGRPLLNLRVAITDSCNLECFYCHREGYCTHHETMTVEEIFTITRIASKFGVRSVKITGGEPLLRKDLNQIIEKIHSLPSIKDVSMVTNGRLLTYNKAKALKQVGLSRVNISVPSIQEETYQQVTGIQLSYAIEGIENALQAKLHPVKINMVLLKGINEGEVNDAIAFAKEKKVILQLIELEPIGLTDIMFKQYHFDIDSIVHDIEAQAQSVRTRKYMQNRKVYSLNGTKIEVVRPIENTEFCLHCTRIRLTHDGKLKPCLMRNDDLIDVLTPIRNGASEEELETLFLKSIDLREPYWKGD